MHQQGVIHRDLKLKRTTILMQTESAGQPRLRVADFGIPNRASQGQASQLDHRAEFHPLQGMLLIEGQPHQQALAEARERLQDADLSAEMAHDLTLVSDRNFASHDATLVASEL
ncbi:MAG: hypothetical protein SNJ82_03720 [Gemmataceae bacterium]